MGNFDVRLYDEAVSFNENNPVTRRFSLGRWQLCYLCMQQTRGMWSWVWAFRVMACYWADNDKLRLRPLPSWTVYALHDGDLRVCRVCAPTKDACLNLRDWLFGANVDPDKRAQAIAKAREMAQHNSPLRPWHNPRSEHA